MYCYYKCSVALPHGASGWSAVCDCGISWSYSLTFCGHLLGKGWPLGSLVCDVFLCFRHFPIWYSGSGVVFYCLDSWSLPSSLLCTSNNPGDKSGIDKFIIFPSNSLLINWLQKFKDQPHTLYINRRQFLFLNCAENKPRKQDQEFHVSQTWQPQC